MRRCSAALLALGLLLTGRAAPAQELALSGSIRNFNLLRLADAPAAPGARRDINFLSLRVIPKVTLGDAWTIESHGVLDVLAPVQSVTVGLPGGSTEALLPLTGTITDTDNARVTARLDRLSARLHTDRSDLTIGRQAITWGVNTLLPALDMFSPFAPTQIDRDYKAGVDAVRLSVSPRPHVDIEGVVAQLGPWDTRASAVGGLVRLSTGAVDVGFMGGSFRHDAVAGGFMSVGVKGTVLRGEVSRTAPDDPIDRGRRPSFWRGGVGLDRQLSSVVGLTAEVVYDGFGERRAADYPLVLVSPRVRRGEVTSPGLMTAGGTVTWRFHPLGTLSTLALMNLTDASVAINPIVSWSASSRLDLMAGGQVFVGRAPLLPGMPRSEYGGLGSAVVTGLKAYF